MGVQYARIIAFRLTSRPISRWKFWSCTRESKDALQPQNTYIYSLQIVNNTNWVGHQSTIAVGFVEENVNLLPVIGWRDGSWGYHSDDGSIITENNIVIDGAPPYESGQTVGVAIDMVRRKACFVLDDTWTSKPRTS